MNDVQAEHEAGTKNILALVEELPAQSRILLVDDNESVRTTLTMVLKHHGFRVQVAEDVNSALALIGAETFDLLLTDLHMPQPGDGLTVVSAMRHANPQAVTIIFSGYPEMKQALAAILEQADTILVKPMGARLLIETIQRRLVKGITTPAREALTVGDILEARATATIADWLVRVDHEPDVITVALDAAERTSHLPLLFADLITRLRHPLPLGTRAFVSAAAAAHGKTRCEQGYSARMLVEESRMLQVSIFQTLQNNLHMVDFSQLLVGVMAIADEVDSQLAQAMTSFLQECKPGKMADVPDFATL